MPGALLEPRLATGQSLAPRRPWLNWRLGVCAGALLGLGLIAFVMAAGIAADPRRAIVRGNHGAFPEALRGPLSELGISIQPHGFMLLLGAASLCYLLVLALAPAVPLRVAVVAVVAAHLIMLLAPPLLSSDVFNYVAYARLEVVHHLNPYQHALAAAPTDPSFPFIGWKIRTTAYGPLFTLGTLPLALLPFTASLWAIKAVTALASLGCVALVAACARRLGRAEVPAILFFGLNPILLFYAVGGAHNDVLMLLPMMLGVYLVIAGASSGPAAGVVAAAVKLSAAVVAPFALLGSRRRGPATVWTLASLAVTLGVGLAAFGLHLFSVLGILRHESHTGSRDVPQTLAKAVGVHLPAATMSQIGFTVFAAVIAYLLVRVWRGADWLAAAGWATLALLATTTYLLPWYVIWPLPLAALSSGRAQRLAALAICGLVIALRIPSFG
ncbi:MAG: alpha,6-mannosyltransferase [Solirubrobacterales bacterium]|jgi:hypothetical protein|nr:alpha,6-mannosyltransferase [Solirubrobacterales bacterium]